MTEASSKQERARAKRERRAARKGASGYARANVGPGTEEARRDWFRLKLAEPRTWQEREEIRKEEAKRRPPKKLTLDPKALGRTGATRKERRSVIRRTAGGGAN